MSPAAPRPAELPLASARIVAATAAYRRTHRRHRLTHLVRVTTRYAFQAAVGVVSLVAMVVAFSAASRVLHVWFADDESVVASPTGSRSIHIARHLRWGHGESVLAVLRAPGRDAVRLQRWHDDLPDSVEATWEDEGTVVLDAAWLGSVWQAFRPCHERSRVWLVDPPIVERATPRCRSMP